MKRLLLLGGFFLCGALLLGTTGSGHGGCYHGPPGGGGGSYGGPGDSPPGGGGGRLGFGNPSSPGAAGPSAPGPASPESPIPGSPGAAPPSPGGAASSGPATPGGTVGVDLTLWDYWWGFNREPYLNLKARIHRTGTLTGSDSFYLGHGQQGQAKDSLRPSQDVIRSVVVPALKNALATERANDILDSSLIALAKIGDVAGSGESEFEGIIKEFLKDGNQAVSETAAVSLGILASDSSFGILRDLALDNPGARKFIGKVEVPIRSRAYACYGLGLLAYRTGSNELRQDVAEVLMDLLTSPHFSRRDIKVAAMVALGLTPIDSIPGLPAASKERKGRISGNHPHVLSRERQLDFLLGYFDSANVRANGTSRHWFVRSHAPAAMARLLPGAAPEYKAKVAELLMDSLARRSKETREILMSSTLALGQIGTAEDDGKSGINNRIRTELIRVIKQGEPQSRRFAIIALGQSGGTPGAGERGLAGADVARKELLRQLSQGKNMLRPWAGLALGVMGRQLLDHGEIMSDSAGMALRSAAADCKRPSEIGAYLLGMGIRRDLGGRDICLDKIEFFTGDDPRGYAAIALGLMQDRASIGPIRDIIKASKYKPGLLKQAAIALGLLGDKQLVTDLVKMLEEARGLATQAAVSSALGIIGDSRSIDPLIELLRNDQVTDTARGFAAVALGIVCDKESLPWNTKISTNINYRASTITLTGDGAGILDLL